MYICVSTLKKAAIGDIIVLEKDYEFSEILAKEIGGGIIGFAMHVQPDGCVDRADALKYIGNRRIIAKVALCAGDVAVLYSDSTVLTATVQSTTKRENVFA